MADAKQYSASLNRVVAALAHRVTEEEVADGVVREAATVLGASASMVWTLDEARDRIRMVASIGYPAAVKGRWTDRPMGEYPLVAAALRGEAVFTSSRLSDARFDSALAKDFGDGAGFVMPMRVGGRILGGLAMSFDHVRAFDDVEREFIASLAGHCAQSLARAQLFEAAHRATAAAEAARRDLEAVLHQLPIGVVVTGADGSIRINQATQRIFGTDVRVSTAEIRDAKYPPSLMRHLDGRSYEAEEVPMARALGGEIVPGEEMYMTRNDGSTCLVRVNAAPIRDEAGCVVAAVAVFSDVTHDHAVAEELRRNERRYRAVLRATNDVIWEVEGDSHRLEWNGALERQFGHSPEATNAHPGGGLGWWVANIHPEDRDRVLASFNLARGNGSETWTSEYRMRRADGTYVATFDRCVFEREPSGRVARVIGAITDVSEQRLLLDELRDAVRVRDDFLSIAGHELRTPLATLSAQLLALRSLPLDEAGRSQKLASAERQTRRLKGLVDELLDVSRIVHGNLQLQCDDVDLAEIARAAAARLEEDFQRGGTRLELDAGATVRGRWDPLRIDLVITNLLTNALRYGEKRPVKLEVSADGDLTRVTITDQGMGIHPDDQARIFERFVRAVPARQFGGLGVGLWLARQIAEAHGGTLRVVSTPGAGAAFTLQLPVAP